MFAIGEKVKVEYGNKFGYGRITERLRPDYYAVIMDNGDYIPYIFAAYLKRID